jgi:hypothetical protein
MQEDHFNETIKVGIICAIESWIALCEAQQNLRSHPLSRFLQSRNFDDVEHKLVELCKSFLEEFRLLFDNIAHNFQTLFVSFVVDEQEIGSFVNRNYKIFVYTHLLCFENL